MANSTSSQDSPFGRAIVTTGILWALYSYPPGPYADPLHLLFWWFGALLAGVGVIKSLPAVFGALVNLGKYLRATRRDDTTKGSAAWLTEKEARKAGLHRRRKGSRIAGIIAGTTLWLRTETHHLVIGPAGSQKTTAVIDNILMGSSESALVSDVKGELWETTQAHRTKKFGHRCVKIDPKDPENSARINPLDRIVVGGGGERSGGSHPDAGYGATAAPRPPGAATIRTSSSMTGARQLCVMAIFAVIVVLPPEHRNLVRVYQAINDLDVLHDLLVAAAKSPALNGEVASMAKSLHAAAFGDDGAAKTFEQFRLGALQALEAFGPGNYLAAITCETTFSFKELKERPTSVYLIIDYANTAVLGKFSGLLQWLAADELVAVGNNVPVLFVLDEFCNSPLYTLPKILTLLRTYGIKCILATPGPG